MGWISLLPVGLTDAEKRCLETIEQRGSYFDMGSLDLNALGALEERELLSAHRSEHYGTLVYDLTESGKLWLQGCRREGE